MSRELKELTLLLENCQTISVSAEDIEEFRVEDIVDELFFYGEVESYKAANRFSLVLKDSINSKQVIFPDFSEDDDSSNFEKIVDQCNIVEVVLEYVNGDIDTYSVSWSPNNDFTNDFESVKICGKRLIVFVADPSIEKYKREKEALMSKYCGYEDDCTYYDQLKILDIENKGNLIRLYLGDPDLEKWYGDDWNDAPLEHNAGLVNDEFVLATKDIIVPFEKQVSCINNDYRGANSPYCKNDFINSTLPYLMIYEHWDNYWEYGLEIADKECYYLGQLIDVDEDVVWLNKESS